MTRCQSASVDCRRVGTIPVRIDRVGDRRVCPACAFYLVNVAGIARLLDPSAPVPAWRQRDLRRDMTRSVA